MVAPVILVADANKCKDCKLKQSRSRTINTEKERTFKSQARICLQIMHWICLLILGGLAHGTQKVEGHREDDGGVLLRTDVVQGLQVSQLGGSGLGGDD